MHRDLHGRPRLTSTPARSRIRATASADGIDSNYRHRDRRRRPGSRADAGQDCPAGDVRRGRRGHRLTYLVTNTGNVTLAGPFTVSDDQATDEACPATAPLAPGDSVTCTASDTIDQADLDAGSLTNTATATNGSVTSNTDSETVDAIQNPALTLVKTATPGTYDSVGDVISYSYLVTNTGNVTLDGPFTIADDQATNEACPASAPLAPGGRSPVPRPTRSTRPTSTPGSLTNTATRDQRRRHLEHRQRDGHRRPEPGADAGQDRRHPAPTTRSATSSATAISS